MVMKIGMKTNNVLSLYNKNSKQSIPEQRSKTASDTIELSIKGRELSKYIDMVKA